MKEQIKLIVLTVFLSVFLITVISLMLIELQTIIGYINSLKETIKHNDYLELISYKEYKEMLKVLEKLRNS